MADLCSLSQDAVSQNEIDLNNNEFINNYLLVEDEVENKVNATIVVFKNSASSRLISLLNYLRATTRANFLVSALNTNVLIRAYPAENRYILLRKEISIGNSILDPLSPEFMGCSTRSPTAAVSFIRSNRPDLYSLHMESYEPSPFNEVIRGFFAGCTPLEGLLESTLDCLGSFECIESLMYNFPAISQVCMITV